MSFLGSAFKFIAPIVGGAVGGPVGAAIGAGIGGAVESASQQNQIQRALVGQAAFAAPAIGLPGISLEGAPTVPVAGQRLPPGVLANIPASGAGLGGACPMGFHLDKRTRSRCVRNRRMNPLNGRAATRAIRRIKGARKMLQKIERQLPRAKSRTAPRRPHHHHVVEH